jgi:hypothetical protein
MANHSDAPDVHVCLASLLERAAIAILTPLSLQSLNTPLMLVSTDLLVQHFRRIADDANRCG